VDIQDKDTEIVIKADTPGLTGADLTVRSACNHCQSQSIWPTDSGEDVSNPFGAAADQISRTSGTALVAAHGNWHEAAGETHASLMHHALHALHLMLD
jgi:hypothetical protein